MSRETPFPVGVVDNLEDKNDEHSTKKRHHNTTLGPEFEHSRSHNTTLGSESELVGEFEDNSSSSAQKGNHSPHNSEVSDTRAESQQPGVVDSLEDKKDEHSTRKRQYKTLGPDTDPESDHGHRKHPHNALGSESELVGEFEENSTSTQKGNHSPHNSKVSDTQAESEHQGVVLQEGYSMICKVCAVENCRSGYNKPIFMVCHLCRNHGKHWPKNCPTGKYRGPPMPEQYGCFYWNKKF